MSDWRTWRPTRRGQALHIDNGYGYAVCGVGALAEPIEGKEYRLGRCARCTSWDGGHDA